MDKLENINKENTFKTPKDYFDYLPSEIMDRIQKEPKQKEIFIFKPAFAISSLAVISGIILLVVFLLKKGVPSEEMIFSENEVQYIIENPELYNIDDAAITEKYLSCIISDESLNIEAAISDDEIKSFLEENADVNNIINEL